MQAQFDNGLKHYIITILQILIIELKKQVWSISTCCLKSISHIKKNIKTSEKSKDNNTQNNTRKLTKQIACARFIPHPFYTYTEYLFAL